MEVGKPEGKRHNEEQEGARAHLRDRTCVAAQYTAAVSSLEILTADDDNIGRNICDH
jgi:hypothetical protein